MKGKAAERPPEPAAKVENAADKPIEAATEKVEAKAEEPKPSNNGVKTPPERLFRNIRDEILREFKTGEKPWQKMNQDEQQRIIDRVESIARGLILEAIDITAARGFDCYDVTLGNFTVKRDSDGIKFIEAKISTQFDAELLASLGKHIGMEVILVARDKADFFKDTTKAKPDVVGTLAMPVPTGPGAPSDDAAIAALGRGNGAAAPAGAAAN